MWWEGGEEDVRVDVVDADEVVLHEDLAFGGLGDGEVGAVLQDLDAASLLNKDALHGLGEGGCHGADGGGEVETELGETGIWAGLG